MTERHEPDEHGLKTICYFQDGAAGGQGDTVSDTLEALNDLGAPNARLRILKRGDQFYLAVQDVESGVITYSGDDSWPCPGSPGC